MGSFRETLVTAPWSRLGLARLPPRRGDLPHGTHLRLAEYFAPVFHAWMTDERFLGYLAAPNYLA